MTKQKPRVLKFVLISGVGFAALWVVVIAGIFVTGTSLEEIAEASLVSQLFFLRMGIYSVLILGWPLMAGWIVAPRGNLDDMEDSEREAILDKFREDRAYLVSIRWKLIIALVVFEICAVQRFGLAG